MIGSDSYIDVDFGDLTAGLEAIEGNKDGSVNVLGMERRERLRYPIHLSAFCMHGDQPPSKALIWDFSSGGIRLSRVLRSAMDSNVTVTPTEIGDTLVLLLRLPERRDPFTLECEVRRVRRDDDYEEIGIEATNIDPAVFQSLSRLSDRVQVKLHSRLPQLFGERDWKFVERYLDLVTGEIFRRMHELLTLLTEWGEDSSTRAGYFYAMVELRPLEPNFKRLLLRTVYEQLLPADAKTTVETQNTFTPRGLDVHTLKRLDWVDFEQQQAATQCYESEQKSPFTLLAAKGQPIPAELFSPKASVLEPSALTDSLRKTAARVSIPTAAAPVFAEVIDQVCELYWDTLQAD